MNLRPCATCGEDIPDRAYQNPVTVRACSPQCAGLLHKREEALIEREEAARLEAFNLKGELKS